MWNIKLRSKRAPFREAPTRFLLKRREQAILNAGPSISSSACQIPTPLKVSELLESILLHVDERTLLVSAQRVNKRWRDIITNSSCLQKKLFLMPDDSDAAARDPQHNPLLAETFPFCFDDLTAYPSGARRVVWAKSDIFAARPPVFKQRQHNPLTQLPQWRQLWSRRRRAALGQPQASWRRMLVHQPPAIVSEVLTPMQHGEPRKWAPIPRRIGPALEMQDLMLCILGDFRLGLRYGGGEDDEDDYGAPRFEHNRLVIEVNNASGFEVAEGLEWPSVAGFKVIWRLQEPGYARRRRAVEEACDPGNEDSSESSGVVRQRVLVLHDVELESAAPLDRHFEQLKEILFPS
ncbi:hypothetical protein PG985_008916 [Apiospora marii]|uniref:uncharacterized protein n=1 Tax=Apiospora marii TaxID=335849 RepID=UPI0031304CA7